MRLDRPQIRSTFSESVIAFLIFTSPLFAPLFKKKLNCSVQNDSLLSDPLASHHLCPSSPRPSTGCLPGRGSLSGGRDCNSLGPEISVHWISLHISVIPQSQCRKGNMWCQVCVRAQCYFRFIALLECVPPSMFVFCTHSCSLPLMLTISLQVCRCLCTSIHVGYFLASVCVLIEAISC